MNTQAKLSLLVVDDDAPIRKLLERVGMRAGFQVDCARDGVEALQMLEQKQYAIAIIDLMMPRLSGYELVQKISTMNPRPIVLVATALTNGDVSKIDDTLVRRVIRKPFDVQAVAEALIETAKHVVQNTAQTPLPVAPPEAGIIRVIEPDDIQTEEEKKDDSPETPKEDRPAK